MGFLRLHTGWCVSMCVLWFFFIFECGVNAGTVSIDDTHHIATTDENFVCAGLDLWPPTKCDYGNCPWGTSSILNADFNNEILKNAVKAFAPLRLRLGGTLQDRLIYQTKRKEPCDPTFVRDTSQLLNFGEACLPLDRWDEINSFLDETGAIATFGLNALNGKKIQMRPDGIATAIGVWDSSNAKSLIKYTNKKGYKIHGWALGNELGGHILFIGVPPEPYAEDTEILHNVLKVIHENELDSKPSIIAPAGLYNHTWYHDYIEKTTASGHLQVISHHIYNLGSGNDVDLVDKVFNLTYLDETTETLKNLQNILRTAKSPTVAWIDEAGGAYNSGKDGVSNAFAYTFWYLNMLGLSSIYNTKVFCRQTLVGGYYGILDTNTFVPNPDYYSALLWHRLMGKAVLSTEFIGTENVRAYAHCAKKYSGITILLMNHDRNNPVEVNLDSEKYGRTREEYHLSPLGGNIYSRIVLLNGKPLTIDSTNAIPAMAPVVTENVKEPIKIAPHSVVFVHMRHATVPACTR